MEKESKKKIYELILNFDVKGEETGNQKSGKQSFIMKYWLDKIRYKNEEKFRFLFLPEESILRKRYENILNSSDIYWGNVRFEDHHCYVLIMPKKSLN